MMKNGLYLFQPPQTLKHANLTEEMVSKEENLYEKIKLANKNSL